MIELKSKPDSIEELTEDPGKFGMPTFDEFRRKKDTYLGRKDDEITAVDRGDPVLRIRQRYYIQSYSGEYRLDAIEQAERIAGEMGKDLFTDFFIDPQIRDDDGLYTRVTFRPKDLVERRRHWS